MDSFLGMTEATEKGIGFVAQNLEKQQQKNAEHELVVVEMQGSLNRQTVDRGHTDSFNQCTIALDETRSLFTLQAMPQMFS